MDTLVKDKMIYFFKCGKCGVEFMIYSEREINDKLCGECKKLMDADNYRRTGE